MDYVLTNLLTHAAFARAYFAFAPAVPFLNAII